MLFRSQDIQADEKNPNDCAKDPHEVTHTVDGVRYYCVSRVLPAQPQREQARVWEDEDEEQESYDEFMCGGEITAGYLIG